MLTKISMIFVLTFIMSENKILENDMDKNVNNIYLNF